MAVYADFTILLDDPAQTPGLGFNAYADALAGIVAHSRAEFAVGIFGTWGSGKTTLMRAIQARLKGRADTRHAREHDLARHAAHRDRPRGPVPAHPAGHPTEAASANLCA